MKIKKNSKRYWN